MIDPYDIETRYATEDGMAFLDSIFDEPSEESREDLEKVRAIMEQLPPREADFVDLYVFHRLKQTDIAAIFRVSQPTVCYRLQRATDRIKYLLQLPQVDEEALQRDIADFLTDPLDVQIMLLMCKTTCQSEVAKQLKVSQGLVRHRFLRTVKKMKDFLEAPNRAEEIAALKATMLSATSPQERDVAAKQMRKHQDALRVFLGKIPERLKARPGVREDFAQYIKLFEFISDNLNILREVQKPILEPKVFIID